MKTSSDFAWSIVLLVLLGFAGGLGCSSASPDSDPGTSRGRVVATVNGVAITDGDVASAISERFPSRVQALDFLIGEALLLQEAERLGIDEDLEARRRIMVQALLDSVAAEHGVEEITRAEIEAEYEAAAERLASNGAGELPSLAVAESPIREGLAGRHRAEQVNEMTALPRLEPERTRALLDLPIIGATGAER